MEVNLSATGFWKINNVGKEYHGDLYLNEDNGGIVIYLHIPNKKPPMSYLTFPLSIPFIAGSTLSGASITLINCKRIKTESRIGVEEIFGYQAQFMLEGVNFNNQEDIKFTKMKVNIPGIIQWGDQSNYKEPALDNKESLIDLEPVELVKIYSHQDYTLYYHLSFSIPFDLMEEEIILTQTPFLIIEASSKHPLDWFIEITNRMKSLIEIAMGKPLYYGSMIVESPDITYAFEDAKKYIHPIKVIHALTGTTQNNNKNTRSPKYEFLFSLEELRQANFSMWAEVATKLEPIIELYIDSLYNEKLSTSRHFLNMIQALETYHSRRIASSLSDFKKRVEKIIEVRHIDARDRDRDFLLKGCEKQRHVTLKNRLTDLYLAEFRFFFYTGNIREKDFPQTMTDTRNYYTHYNPNLEGKALKGQNLVHAFYILQNMLEFYLLKELGFSEQFIHERIRTRIEHVKINIDVKKAEEDICRKSVE